MEDVVYVHASRAAIRNVFRTLPSTIQAGGSEVYGLMARLGLTLLGRIRKAFITKARGGVDEAGDWWKHLAPSTIARRRKGRRRSGSIEILRDTGLLFNSLSPGVQSQERIFRVGHGEVVVGTNRKGAAQHHKGNPARKLPQRRLWPAVSKWPDSWWKDLSEQARAGVMEIVSSLLRNP